MRTLSLSLLTCAHFLAPTMAHAGANAGASVYLSWKGQTSTDLPSPADGQVVYVNFKNLTQYKGGEVTIIWTPDSGCTESTGLAHGDLTYPTSGSCPLNRGNVVPVFDTDGPGVIRVAWANGLGASTCTSGVAVAIPFLFNGCSSVGGCFGIVSARVIDGANVQDEASISGTGLTFRGGSATDCKPGPRGRSWAKIKSIYGHK